METKTLDRAKYDRRAAAIHNPARLGLIAGSAIAAHLFLLASSWLLPAASEFTLVGDNISELVLGRYGFVQTAAFLAAGIGTLALAYAIKQLAANTWGNFIGSLLVAINGAGLLIVGWFPTDRIDAPAEVWRSSTIGMIHIIASIVSLLSIIAAMFVFAWTLRKDTRWRPLYPWLGIFPGGALALFFAQGEGPIVGILQRSLTALISLWVIMLAFRIRRMTVPRT